MKRNIFPQIDDITKKNFRLLLFALIIGLLAGLSGTIFRLTLEFVEHLRIRLFENAGDSGLMSWIWPLIFAIVGITVSLYLVRRFAPESAGSGVQEIEGALDDKRPVRWKRVIPIKFIASLFSLGSGLLLGREGPTIQLGANIGQMVKDLFKPADIKSNPLISAGAAAGLASAFNAPFAGIIFVIEEMHDHFRFNLFSVAAIMIGAGVSDFVVRAILDASPVIQMEIYPAPDVLSLWIFVILGLVFSFVGYFFNKLLLFSLDYFQFLTKSPVIFVGIITGLCIALIGILYPEMVGGGYTTINKVLDHSFSLKFLILLFIVRFFLTVFSYSTGVSGGIFIPMLTLGLILGMSFGTVMQEYFPDFISYPAIFAIAGMAAIFASTVGAPLTGLVLAIEMTSNFELILPLIITTVAATVGTALLGNKPIYATLLQRTLKESEAPAEQRSSS
ncbi:MAG: H(+)/Cl(-) exchange transporter ClcA [Bacteroidetes bacterium]|nr:H(+)/Cl(-) exchange transporter ClcA [Bacteroidota bacterium]